MASRSRAWVPECTHPPPAAAHECWHTPAHSDPSRGCPRLPWHSHAQSACCLPESYNWSATHAAPAPPTPTLPDRSSDPPCSDTPQYSALPPAAPATHARASAASVHPAPPPPGSLHPLV